MSFPILLLPFLVPHSSFFIFHFSFSMTLQQLKYVDAVASCGSLSEASRRVFVTQPTLTEAIQTLEEELRIAIFSRSGRGVTVTREGEEFLASARQILEDAARIQAKYTGKAVRLPQFAVSCQHYAFAVEAFIEVVKAHEADAFDYTLRETVTSEIIDDVARHRSEIGVLALNDDKERYLRRMFGRLDLEFTELIRVPAAVYIAKDHPLAGRSRLTPEELAPYPCITFEQGEHNGQFFFEGLSSIAVGSPRQICVRERSTEYQLIRELHGFCPDVGLGSTPQVDSVSIPLEPERFHTIGYILRRDLMPSRMTTDYIENLKSTCSDID